MTIKTNTWLKIIIGLLVMIIIGMCIVIFKNTPPVNKVTNNTIGNSNYNIEQTSTDKNLNKNVDSEEKATNGFSKLGDNDIQKAINDGKNSKIDNVIGYKLTANYNDAKSNDVKVYFYTPYQMIKLKSYQKSSNYEDYLLADGKEEYLGDQNTIMFVICLTGDSIDFHKNAVVVIKQGNLVLQPTSIYGKDEIADVNTNTDSYNITYNGNLTVAFKTTELDLSKPVQLIVSPIPLTRKKAIYNINFKKYK